MSFHRDTVSLSPVSCNTLGPSPWHFFVLVGSSPAVTTALALGLLGTPKPPAIRSARGTYFGASCFTHLLRPANLLAPLSGSARYARPSRSFTSSLPTDRSPSPLLGMTTTATGLLCRRDFHPLEWQLASLHQIRTCGFPAYGSHLGSNRQSNCRMRSGACGTRAWR